MYVHGIWCVGNDSGNWLGKVFRDQGKWFFEYRFRYYVDDKAHDSEDVKNWYKFAAPDDSQDSLQKMLHVINRELLPEIEKRYGTKADYVDLQCEDSDPKFFFEVSSRPWAHVRMEPA